MICEIMTYCIAIYGLLLLITICSLPVTISIVYCSVEEGNGVCPDNSKCCKILGVDGTSISSGCIPHNPHIEGDGVCCEDDYSYIKSGVGTGCAGNYKCDSKLVNRTMDFFCSLHRIDEHGSKGEVTIMPRYELVDASIKQLSVQGFPIAHHEYLKMTPIRSHQPPVLACYSNFDIPLLLSNETPILDARIQLVIIVVHGSGRNADEYLYSTMGAVEKQDVMRSDSVLIIAPRFLAMEDGVEFIPAKIGSSTKLVKPMMWNETYPIPHTWRYGANALQPWSDLSSYDVMDALVEYFADSKRFQNLSKIAVIGHSAGAQFTHRWALLSNSLAWGDWKLNNSEGEDNVSISRRLQAIKKGLPLIQVVAANPRSYCYLDERRIIDGIFQSPPKSMIEQCPHYDNWEWGLAPGGDLLTPYKDRALAFFKGNVTKLSHRYAFRHITYLSGYNDTEILHGSCADDLFQGKFRRERSEHYFKSLKSQFGALLVHSRLVVQNVGHDHSLIFASEEGITAIFN